jgi:flavin-dependent dehydrogenase
VVVVGDAAGYYDPFTGQGIYRALRTAELAAEAVDQSLAMPRAAWEPLAGYDRRWRREVRSSSLVQRAVERVMARPFLRDGTLRRLEASGGLPVLIRVTGDATRARTLLRPSAWIGNRRCPC